MQGFVQTFQTLESTIRSQFLFENAVASPAVALTVKTEDFRADNVRKL